MKITRDNYEPYFLDFLDGNLDEDQIDQFLDFLKQNPDLKEELHGLEHLKLDDEPALFAAKDKLYKSNEDAKALRESKMIAHLEGDLNEEEKAAFESYLAGHPVLENEYNLFRKTKLLPDPAIHFPDKRKLHRKSGVVIFVNWAARAAAVVALIWGISTLFPGQNDRLADRQQTQLAEITPKDTPPPKSPESEEKQENPEVKTTASPEKAKKTEIPGSIREKAKERLEQKKSEPQPTPERNLIALATIRPQEARLETHEIQAILAVSVSKPTEDITTTRVMTIDEYLALQAKKVEEEGVLSARRLVRAGLGLASELSGDRIGYREKNGKITALDFDTKLLAFSIPLKKD